MKNFVRFAVAGALIAGYHSAAMAQAATQPSGNASDLWLFVTNQTAGTTFAEDTGITLNSLMPSSKFVAGATLSTNISANISLAAGSALSSYLTANSGANLQWGIEGSQYLNSVTQGKSTTPPYVGAKNAGGIINVTDNNGVGSNTSQMQLSNLQAWAGGFQSDVTYLTPTYVSGGTTYQYSAGGNTGNVWGSTGPGTAAGSTSLYGNGADQLGVGLGQTAALYGLTGNGGTGQAQSYLLGSLELTSAGLLETIGSTPPTTPLPAAVWLFGSGLLGLVGVGRRRAASAA
jgi:hypothetical protein